MSVSRRRAPSPYLLDAKYWRERLTKMETVQRGLLLLPRPDLSTPLVDVVEWRLKAHDGLRLWGLRATSPFHPAAKGAMVREVPATELPEIDVDSVAEGQVDFVFQIPPGRRLEDRVLDLLRVYQVAVHSGVDPHQVQLVPHDGANAPDEFMIAIGLVRQGLC
jgi:hypothetical protein